MKNVIVAASDLLHREDPGLTHSPARWNHAGNEEGLTLLLIPGTITEEDPADE